MSMLPIPKKLLIHSATLNHAAGLDAWQKPAYAADIALTYIRIEPTSKIVVGANNQQLQLTSLLFFDARNSKPAGTVFVIGDRVTFGGAEHRVYSVDPLYDTKLHHYEIGLI